MQYQAFIDSLDHDTCPDGLEPCLQALWYEAKGEWNTAHEIVQQMDDIMAARIHAYLHRREGDDWNSRYWYRRTGSTFPGDQGLESEWDTLVRGLAE